jgi:hypothetical protein
MTLSRDIIVNVFDFGLTGMRVFGFPDYKKTIIDEFPENSEFSRLLQTRHLQYPEYPGTKE